MVGKFVKLGIYYNYHWADAGLKKYKAWQQVRGTIIWCKSGWALHLYWIALSAVNCPALMSTTKERNGDTCRKHVVFGVLFKCHWNYNRLNVESVAEVPKGLGGTCPPPQFSSNCSQWCTYRLWLGDVVSEWNWPIDSFVNPDRLIRSLQKILVGLTNSIMYIYTIHNFETY